MDTIKIKFGDGNVYKLPDISSEKFDEFMFKNGSNDVEYEKYKRENGMKELTDFNGESTSEITLVVEQSWRGRVLKFKCIYDSDNDKNFNEEQYFVD
jgi:mRNA-degrading endonuclease RelE of RelBE toxin-antitoxin system